MKKIIYLFVLLLCTSYMNQSDFNEGIYEYKSGMLYERMELNKDFHFKYDYHFHFISFSLEGNYRIKGDSLILDSSPQRDKVIVREYRKGSNNKLTFNVKDKLGASFNYFLFLISKDNDTITLSNQWSESKLRNKKIESFYIVDSKGLRTPLYKIKGAHTNFFEIQMEPIRVLDNEVWRIQNYSIFPKGMNGENQNYVLNKITND